MYFSNEEKKKLNKLLDDKGLRAKLNKIYGISENKDTIKIVEEIMTASKKKVIEDRNLELWDLPTVSAMFFNAEDNILMHEISIESTYVYKDEEYNNEEEP